LLVTSLGLLTLPYALPAEAKFHKGLLDDPKGKAERSAECAKGDTKVERKIVSGTIKHAKEKYKIASLVDANDEKRSEKEMYDFLNWKLGSPSAVCGQYITGGQKHFNKGYTDEAAASLLGMELPGGGRTEFKLPKRISDQLKAQIKSCADQVAGAVAGKAPASPAPASQSATDKLTAQAMEKVSPACKQQVDKLRQQLEKDYASRRSCKTWPSKRFPRPRSRGPRRSTGSDSTCPRSGMSKQAPLRS